MDGGGRAGRDRRRRARGQRGRRRARARGQRQGDRADRRARDARDQGPRRRHRGRAPDQRAARRLSADAAHVRQRPRRDILDVGPKAMPARARQYAAHEPVSSNFNASSPRRFILLPEDRRTAGRQGPRIRRYRLTSVGLGAGRSAPVRRRGYRGGTDCPRAGSRWAHELNPLPLMRRAGFPRPASSVCGRAGDSPSLSGRALRVERRRRAESMNESASTSPSAARSSPRWCCWWRPGCCSA